MAKNFIASLLLAASGWQHGAPARPADALLEAEALLEKQQFDQAEAQLLGVLGMQPKNAQDSTSPRAHSGNAQSGNPQAWFDLGFAESHLGKTPEAIAAYKKAAGLSPQWFEASLNLGLALAQAGDYPQAAPVLKNTVQLKPVKGNEPALGKAWLSLAQVLEKTDPQEALNAYRKAAELQPADPESLAAAGNLMEQGGDLAGAEQQYLKAAGMGSNTAMARLAAMYGKQNRLPDAETWLRKFTEQNPQNTLAKAQLGRVLAAEGKTQDAIATLEAANQAAADPKISRELAGLYLDAKQYEAAAAAFQKVTSSDPADAEAHLGLGMALLHQRQYPGAEAELLQAVQRKPSLTEAYYDLAYAAAESKDYPMALRVLEARAKLLPETPGTYFLRATSFDNLRAYKQAAENYRLFLSVSAGKSPDQEFQARHRLIAIERK